MAMVEMVFVLPVLLLILFAIAEFGLMFNRWLTLSNAAREGARVGVLFRSPCDGPTVKKAAEDAVKSYAASANLKDTSTPPFTSSNINVTGMCDTVTRNFKVEVTYPFTLQIPFFASTTIPLKYSSTMRNE